MGWIEDALKEKELLVQIEREKPFRLVLNTPEDIPSDLTQITSVHFSSRYKGNSPIELLHGILQEASELRNISIFVPVPWNEICSLELNGIQELTFCLDGVPGEKAIVAAQRKKLCIFGRAMLTPLELLVQPYLHIDYSGIPHLVSLELKEFQQVYPDDFMNLTELESLSISKAEINDLLWLERAQYQLKYLFINANIIDCSGIESQNHLETLILSHTCFHDVDPIEHLSKLEMLDLRWNEIQDEGTLRDKGIPHVLITREDGARYTNSSLHAMKTPAGLLRQGEV